MKLIKRVWIICAGVSAMAIASPVMAQTSNFEDEFLQRGAEARVSLKIPFGRTSKKSADKPRLHFGVRQHYNSDNQNFDWMRPHQELRYKDSSFSFSLEKQPQLFVGNQIVTFTEPETAELDGKVKKAGKAALVAGAVVVVIGAVAVGRVLAADGPFDE